MFERLEQIEKRYQEIEARLAEPAIFSDRSRVQALLKERSAISELVGYYREYKKIQVRMKEANQILESEQERDLRMLAEEERTQLEKEKERLEIKLQEQLLEDPDAERNIIVEIRAGTGGEEAGLFAADLFRMYKHYAQTQGWRLEVMNTHPTGIGGLREIIFSIEGAGVYKKMRYESGTHRVQRVPATEASGRIHTSAVTVAILPEPEEVELQVHPKDLKVDVYRSSGPGGQGVNTTDSAVRITHLASGIVVTCQDERSQMKNKAKAMRVLRARLLEQYEAEQQMKISKDRKQQIGTGDRSGRIRTYNFPDRRVTDHRIGLTLYKLENILEGDLEELISSLILYFRQQKLAGK